MDYSSTERKHAREKAMAAVRSAIRDQPDAFKGLEKEWFLRAVQELDAEKKWMSREYLRDTLVVMWVVSKCEELELAVVTKYRNVTASLAWTLGKKICRFVVDSYVRFKAVIEKKSKEVTERKASMEGEKNLSEEREAYGMEVAPPRRSENVSKALREDARALLNMQEKRHVTKSEEKQRDIGNAASSSSSQSTNLLTPPGMTELPKANPQQTVCSNRPAGLKMTTQARIRFESNGTVAEHIYEMLCQEAEKQKFRIWTDFEKVAAWTEQYAGRHIDEYDSTAALLDGYLAWERDTAGIRTGMRGLGRWGLYKLAFAALSEEVSSSRAEKEAEREDEWDDCVESVEA